MNITDFAFGNVLLTIDTVEAFVLTQVDVPTVAKPTPVILNVCDMICVPGKCERIHGQVQGLPEPKKIRTLFLNKCVDRNTSRNGHRLYLLTVFVRAGGQERLIAADLIVPAIQRRHHVGVGMSQV